ncbi:conserved hypothetical protein [Leishmania mexicana MHOM/GT/2001/U1103]|uniref:Uncharacterized protein n=1 Tax=Leishmania mexicana (strain MHOM/GT/2001/U1103) TaxID=929439 RepID=E9AKS3_LEIMU|nr:conserved hypothetical protein [Leishmania mexicana MHOM/GT/2001/U1103]CBZ23525.1 conserved hypothetical protein [Leishmania mexicana MHOM/GT/2001/U1103]
MLHEGRPMYDNGPLGPLDTRDAAERDVLASVDDTYPHCHSSLSTRQQQQHQQRMLQRSMSGSGSCIAAMRCTSSLPVPQGSVGSNPLSPPAATTPPLPFAPVAAAGTAGWDDHEHFTSQHPQQLQKQKLPPGVPPLTPTAEDFVHEILAMNTLAMEQCYAAVAATNGAALVGAAIANPTPNVTPASEEPMRILSEAYMRVDETSTQDFPAPLLDELKTTTLNNMGVVECNRGQPRQALSHFEAARQLEENNGMASPSITLNMCAAYNALRMFDKATAAALETIDMLHSLALQRRRNRRLNASATALLGDSGLPWNGSRGGAMDVAKDGDMSTTDLLLEAAAAPKIADSQNEALWGAAWNNLAVAQVNTARGSKDTSEYTNALSLFQNAMRATQELLGMQHPMSKAVVETFRSVRRALRYHGAFKQHRSLLRAPLPPVDPREQEWEEKQVEAMPGHTRHGTLQQLRQQLTITFRGEVTGGQKVVERLDGTPYPGATFEPYQKQQRMCGSNSGRGNTTAATGTRNRSRSGNKKHPKPQGSISQLMRSIPLSSTLCHASAVYGNPHPLLYSPPPSGQYAESAPLSFSASMRMTDNQYDGFAATPGRAMSAADLNPQGRDRGQHSHTTRSRSGATGRTPPPQRQQHPATTAATEKGRGKRSKSRRTGNHHSQTAPHPSSSRSYPHGNAVGAAAAPPAPQPTRPPVSKVLPPIDMGTSAAGGAAAAFAEYNEGHAGAAGAVPLGYATGTFGDRSSKPTARFVFTQHQSQPQRASKRTPSAPHGSTSLSPSAGGVHGGAAATEYVQQSKMLLLAAPSSGVTTKTTYYPLEVPSGAVAKSAEHRGPTPTPATAQSTWDDAGDPSAGTHELFRGMWVTADPHYVHRGPRVFGRPAYYTIATTVGVTEDGVGGGASVTGTGATASTTQTDSAPRPVLPTLTYSSSGSEEDSDAEGENDHRYEGGVCGAPDVHHHASVSTDAPSSPATPQKNALAETSRMTSS